MSLLRIEKCSVTLGGRSILKDISLTAEEGEVLGILGPNGCGKTTLLKAACGLLPAEGSFLLDGRTYCSLPERKRALLCRYLPQKSDTAVHIPALETVLTGFNPRLGLWEAPTEAMRGAAAAMLEQLGLGTQADRDLMQLSEGQRHLVLLARALVCESRIVLLDEPESALDFGGRYRMLQVIRDWAAKDRAALLSLHDPQLALACCSRLLLLKEGRMIGTLCPAKDSAAVMEEALRELYGPLRVVYCEMPQGGRQAVLLKE